MVPLKRASEAPAGSPSLVPKHRIPHSTSARTYMAYANSISRYTAPPSAAPVRNVKPTARSNIPFYIAGLCLYGLTAYSVNLYMTYRALPEVVGDPVNVGLEGQQDVSHVYDKIAEGYDWNVGMSEFWMGTLLLRRALGNRIQVRTSVPHQYMGLERGSGPQADSGSTSF